MATESGLEPITEVEEGEWVYAYNEATGEVGLYQVTDELAHLDHEIVTLVIEGERIYTTPEHPFYVNGQWIDAANLSVGDLVRRLDGRSGAVEAVTIEERPQVMYNLTVDRAHTFFVGGGQWLVHNCSIGKTSDFVLSHGLSGDSDTKRVIKLADEMRTNGFQNLDSIKIIESNGQKIVVDGHHRLAAARLAKLDVPYEVVDEAWVKANTGWQSLADVVNGARQANGTRLNPHMVKKAGYK